VGDTPSLSANLELVRSIYADWERGDFGSAEWADPDIEFVFADGPEPGSFSGLAGMAEGWRAFLSAWEGYRLAVQEYRELDDERVLVLVARGGRGTTSGLELGRMQTKGAALYHVHGGKVKRIVGYWSRERAFTELGLL